MCSLFNIFGTDMVDERHQETQSQEATRRQYHHQHAVGTADERMAKETTSAKQLAHYAEQR